MLKMPFAVATMAAILIMINETFEVEWTSVFEFALYAAGGLAAIILAVLILKAVLRAMYRVARASVIFAWRLVWFPIVLAPAGIGLAMLGTDEGPVLLVAGLLWAVTMVLFTRPRVAANSLAASSNAGGRV